MAANTGCGSTERPRVRQIIGRADSHSIPNVTQNAVFSRRESPAGHTRGTLTMRKNRILSHVGYISVSNPERGSAYRQLGCTNTSLRRIAT